MKYYAIDRISNGGKHTLNLVDEITPEEHEMLIAGAEFIPPCKQLESMKMIVCYSEQVLMDYTSPGHLSAQSLNGVRSRDILTGANAYALNYATSVRTFIDVMHSKLHDREADLAAIKEFESELYDRHFGYRLWYRLRNYIVHRQLPYSKLSLSLESQSKVLCDKSALLGWEKWGSLRKEIEGLPDNIDLASYCKEMTSCIKYLFMEFVTCFGQELSDYSILLSDARNRHRISGSFMYAIAESREHMHSDGPFSHADLRLFPEDDFIRFFNVLRANPRVTINERGR